MISLDHFIQNGFLNIPEKEWSELNSQFDKTSLRLLVTNCILKNHLPFPYKEKESVIDDFNSLTKEDFKDRWSDKIFQTKVPYKEFQPEPLLVNGTSSGLKCVDSFTEDLRFGCSFPDKPSLLHKWSDPALLDDLLKTLWGFKVKKITRATVLNSICLSSRVASNFKPSVAKAIIDRTFSRKVLDISHGWGGRLLGFLASKTGMVYYGFDPHIELGNRLRDMGEKFGGGRSITIFGSGSEAPFELPEKVDLVLSSPPYFKAENYSKDPGQSSIKNPSLVEWLKNYMYPTLENCWNNLQSAGFIALNLSDITYRGKRDQIVDPVISRMNDRGFIKVSHSGMRVAVKPGTSRTDKETPLAEPLLIYQKP